MQQSFNEFQLINQSFNDRLMRAARHPCMAGWMESWIARSIGCSGETLVMPQKKCGDCYRPCLLQRQVDACSETLMHGWVHGVLYGAIDWYFWCDRGYASGFFCVSTAASGSAVWSIGQCVVPARAFCCFFLFPTMRSCVSSD